MQQPGDEHAGLVGVLKVADLLELALEQHEAGELDHVDRVHPVVVRDIEVRCKIGTG